MTREEFDALVAQLEVRAKASPGGFVARTAALATLGFGFMLAVLLLTITVAVAAVVMMVWYPSAATIKIGVVAFAGFGGIAWALVKALWIRMPAPQGLELRRSNAPRLFAMIDELRAELKSPRFHEVLLVGEHNAAVVQIPRLGVFGWHRNYLLVGLLMMQGLGPEEFRAVLAHEFGHLSGNHGRFHNWLYRLRRSWEKVFDELRRTDRGGVGKMLAAFINWFWPKFNAHAFVLSRANEYEADAVSARLAGSGYAASALQRTSVDAAFLQEEFWPGIFKLANAGPHPPADVYRRAGVAIRTPQPPEELARRLKVSFQLETNNADTHPCLKDRLRALGGLPPGVDRRAFPRTLPKASEESAAELYLGATVDRFERELGEQWKTGVEPWWQQRYQEAQALQEQLATIDATPAPVVAQSPIASAQGDGVPGVDVEEDQGVLAGVGAPSDYTAAAPAVPPASVTPVATAAVATAAPAAPPAPVTVEHLWKKAQVLIDLEGDQSAVTLLDQLIEMRPDHAGACFVRGREYLTRDDARGVDLVERAMKVDESLVPPGCDLLYAHFARTGQREQLRTLEHRVDAHRELEQRAQEERNNIRAGDSFIPHGMTAEQIEHVRTVLRAEPDVGVANVVRKRVRHFPNSPCYVLSLTVAVPWWKPRARNANMQIVERVLANLQLPGYFFVLVVEPASMSLAKAVERVRHSPVYERGR